MIRALNLMLFTHDPELAKQAEGAGIDRIVIDFEFKGKNSRQLGYHLEVNKATLTELRAIRKAISIPIVARINPISEKSCAEIDALISEGADILMLPMFRTIEEVNQFLNLAGDRVAKNLLFETRDSVEIASELKHLAIDEYYIGLNDMAIDCKLSFAYDVLRLDIVQRLCKALPDLPFGFGGITIVGGGAPLKTEVILNKMADYGCSLVILRRAFKRDIQGRSIQTEVSKIKEAYKSLRP